MTILQKEALEYQRALFELSRFLFTGITIFTIAGSFLVNEKFDPKSAEYSNHVFFGFTFVCGMLLTLVTFLLSWAVIAHTIDAMRKSNSNTEAEESVEKILSGIYQYFSWLGGLTIFYWLTFIVLNVEF